MRGMGRNVKGPGKATDVTERCTSYATLPDSRIHATLPDINCAGDDLDYASHFFCETVCCLIWRGLDFSDAIR